MNLPQTEDQHTNTAVTRRMVIVKEFQEASGLPDHKLEDAQLGVLGEGLSNFILATAPLLGNKGAGMIFEPRDLRRQMTFGEFLKSFGDIVNEPPYPLFGN